MTEITVLPQKIVNRKTVVLKSRLDPAMARLLGEKVKGKFFVRLGFLKPKPEEVRIISVDKFYEPYITVGGKYVLDYCKKRAYAIKVDKEAQEIVIAGKKFRLLNPQKPSKTIKLEGEEHFHYEDEAYFILDRMGREVAPEKLPYAPSEEQPEKLAEISKKLREVKVTAEQEIDFLRSRIVNRPPDVDEITKEWFEVNERSIIYIPAYELTFQNVKTGEEAIVEIDGVTGKIIRYRKGWHNLH
ncbi:hypothetical protein KAU93_01050 [Candidatus Bathyarchaeota archaeon]|nr:hypothetical protein [Candidatus Bathyarchaeota archaeon]